MLERLMLVWLTLLSAAAYWWPGLTGGAADPFLSSKPALSALIAVTMFVLGGVLPRHEIAEVARRWPAVLGGTTLQYTVMPLLAYSIGALLRLPADAMIGVVMVGCVPGAMASNVLTLMARGNVSYSVSLTTSATLLSPVVVPIAMLLTLGTRVELNAGKVAFELLLTVVGPVVVGQALARLWARFATSIRVWGPVVANLAILWIIAVVVALNRETLAEGIGVVGGALVAINGLGYLAGYAGGAALRLPEPMRRALTLEIGMQNAGLGTALTLALFPDRSAAAIPPALYTFGCMFTGTALARLWAYRSVPKPREPAVAPVTGAAIPLDGDAEGGGG